MGQATHHKRQPVKVYIIHSDVDLDFARRVRNLLFYRLNAQVCTTEEVQASEKWERKLRNELSSADVVLALLTPHSVDFSRVLHEIGAAWALGKLIIPVVTRRDVLNKLPASLERAPSIESSDVDTPENEAKFVAAFEESVTAAHLS
jgi:nucleoside 2-deoxyribosyltransferase